MKYQHKQSIFLKFLDRITVLGLFRAKGGKPGYSEG
jgi:hypothetical protein